MAPSIGTVLRQAREVRELSAVDAARAAGISAAYLSKLENDAVKKPVAACPPSAERGPGRAVRRPHAPQRLPRARRAGGQAAETVGAALFADLTDDERDELLEYLAWYRARRRSGVRSRTGDRRGGVGDRRHRDLGATTTGPRRDQGS